MRMPEFSAERSLCQAGMCQHMAIGSVALGSSLRASRGVVPQLSQETENCYSTCLLNRSDLGVCFLRCGSGFGNAGGTGGGVGSGSLASCGKCQTTGPHRGQRLCGVPGKGSQWSNCTIHK